MVQRWEQDSFMSCGDCIAQMVTEPDGDWVSYDDYAALKAELDCSQKAFSTERREHEDTLADLEKAREALTSIASGMGRDILGATSLSREDMQSIAKQALEG